MPPIDAPSDVKRRDDGWELWKAEYDQINNNFRMLAETRFKLLAFVPTLSGAAVYLLSKMTAGAGSDYSIVGFISVLGFLATLGITFYDQRNSELYNLLVARGGELERMFDPPMKNFAGRCRAGRFLLGLARMKHDTGLALIYAPVLGAWFFPLVDAILRGSGFSPTTARVAALLSASLVSVVLFIQFLHLDARKAGINKK